MVLLSRPLTNLRRAFIGYLLAMFIWSISSLIIFTEYGDPLTWLRVILATTILTLLSLFYFIQVLFAQRHKWTVFIFWYGLLAIVLSLFSNLVVRSASVESGFIVYEFSPFIVVVAGPGYSLFIFGIVELIRGYRRTENDIQRIRLRYLITALVIITLFSVVNWTELGKYPIDVAANGVAALLIAYAILRHSLLDIRIVFRAGLLYSIITAVTGAFYYLIISIVLTFFESFTGLQIFTVSIIVALITSLILSPLRERVQNWIDRFFYRDKYDASLMLQRLSDATSALMNLDDITYIILHEIITTMKLEQASFFVKFEGDETYQLVSQQGVADGFYVEYRTGHPIINYLSGENQILTRSQLDIDPVFKSLWGTERDTIEKQRIELFVSLVAAGEMVGFFVIGSKKSGLPFTQEDQRNLVTAANHTAIAVKNARLYNDLENTFVQTVVTLANAIDIRDTYTSDHSQRIAALAVETAKELGCNEDEVQEIYWGSLLHDIGKIGVPDSILLKAGPLTEAEWDVIKAHPNLGADLIQNIQQLAHVTPIIRHSHEWYNGRGYPGGLKAEEIPFGARVVAVVDAFSAMVDKRVYKAAYSWTEAVEEIKRFSGKQFDPVVVDAFTKVIESDGYIG